MQGHPNGKVTNIPDSMLKDQYGMAGLLSLMNQAKANPDTTSLALGEDLTELYLNSPYNIYSPIASLWDEHPFRPPEIEVLRPPQYLIDHIAR